MDNIERLTPDEHAFFTKKGYLVVVDALASEQVKELITAIDECTESGDDDKEWNEADILGRDDRFLQLTDLPTVMPRIACLLGWNIWVNHTHFNVSPPTRDETGFSYGWHRDGGNVRRDLRVSPPPMMSIKVGFYLTELRVPHHGQTYVIPDSQNPLHPSDGVPRPTDPPPATAEPMAVRAGTAVIYHPNILHSNRSPNRSETTRKAVFVQWAYRWLQAVDAQSVAKLNDRVDDPVRRQMLGLTANPFGGHGRYFTGRSGRYFPSSDETPLKGLVEMLGEPVDHWASPK